jgi:hypothetical protein
MNGYETVYVPEKLSKTHTCRPTESLDWGHQIKHPKGTIVCCDICGQHWFSHYWGMGKTHEVYTVKWYKVRWWNFMKRRRILGK